MNRTYSFLATWLFVLTATPLSAQITVDGTDFWNSTSDTITGNFNASGSDKLVVVLTGEHGFNNAAGDVTSVTYDGVGLNRIIDRNAQVAQTDTIYHEMWILDDPLTSTGFIEVNAITRANVTVFGLSGTAAGVGATSITPTDTRSVDITTTTDNSLVIASFGMGGAGNTANVTNVTVDAPLTKVSSQENGSNWDGHVVGWADAANAGLHTYSFTGGNVDGAMVIAAEFQLGPPPPSLTLQVNTATGMMTLLGDDEDPVTFAYYEIKSAGQSLSTAGWNSLADQDYEGNGPPDGSGNGWEEAGGSGAHSLAEAYLSDESTVVAGSEINLGRSYDYSVGLQDLEFQFLTGQKIREGNIEYISVLHGDYNEDNVVDLADYTVWRNNLGAVAGTLPNDGDDGAIGNEQYQTWKANFGLSVVGASTATNAVPEPSALVMIGLVAILGFTNYGRLDREL